MNHGVDDECEHQVCDGERGLCDGERSLHKIQWSRRRGHRQSQEALRDGAASRQERFQDGLDGGSMRCCGMGVPGGRGRPQGRHQHIAEQSALRSYKSLIRSGL